MAQVHSSPTTFSNMRDSSTNSWTALGTFTDAANGNVYGAWACLNATGGVKQTCTITLSGSNATDLFLFEFTGVGAVTSRRSLAAGAGEQHRPADHHASVHQLSRGPVVRHQQVAFGTVSFNSPWAGFAASGHGCGYYVTPASATPSTNDNGAGNTSSFVFGLKPSVAAVPPVVATTYYVATAGSDSADGKSTRRHGRPSGRSTQRR